jgi:hypothetical protein
VRLRFAPSSIARQCIFRALHSQQSISAQSTSIASRQKAKGGAQNRAILEFAAQRLKTWRSIIKAIDDFEYFQ